ncbi:MAG: hypothetical protein GTO02_01805, partial [Candidatus Dadabacteria bacterium]|nr:hypothetical protein [Candidatus Dadabacteria bacterium]
MEDILASRQRILSRNDFTPRKEALDMERWRHFREEGDPAQLKYEVWERFQKKLMQVPFFEIEYESL